MNGKRYYWLKLEENYFDIKIQKALRKLPSGAEMLICYLKMQLKYINKGGLIEFNGICNNISEEIALDIDEDEDLVKMTIAILSKWRVLENTADNIYIVEMQERIGSKTDSAKRVEKHRKKQEMLQCNNDVTKCNSIQDIEKDIDIEKEKESNGFKKPSVSEIKSYCEERKNKIDAETFYDFYESKNWFVGKNKMKDWKASVRTWEKRVFGNKNESVPEWFNKEIEIKKPNEEKTRKIEELLGQYS